MRRSTLVAMCFIFLFVVFDFCVLVFVYFSESVYVFMLVFRKKVVSINAKNREHLRLIL